MYWKNLYAAVLAIFHSRKLKEALLNIDRLGNAIAAGHHRVTISGRVAHHRLQGGRYWCFLAWVIDTTFYPLEGPNHCHRALLFEQRHSYPYNRGNDIALLVLGWLVITGCLILLPIFYIYKWLGFA